MYISKTVILLAGGMDELNNVSVNPGHIHVPTGASVADRVNFGLLSDSLR